MRVLIRAEGELRCRHAPTGNGIGYLITTQRLMRAVPESGVELPLPGDQQLAPSIGRASIR
jgi:hypothetical protein